ncbi:MAG: very short patch repair endonuclease, partial [Chitinophagia bacterium]|nr:very short patch repair endonuclease [Chitinophagia bacterium]
LTVEQKRKNMQAVKSKGSKIENCLLKALFSSGLRYRRNDQSVFGKPDVSVKKYKIAVFVDSEFWHGKNWEERKNDHKSNIDFWHKKIQRNMERDKEVNAYLLNLGWTVLRFWGNEIKHDLQKCVNIVLETKQKRMNAFDS